jgi:hypothetical protein
LPTHNTRRAARAGEVQQNLTGPVVGRFAPVVGDVPGDNDGGKLTKAGARVQYRTQLQLGVDAVPDLTAGVEVKIGQMQHTTPCSRHR